MEKDIELNSKDGIEVRKGKHLKQGDAAEPSWLRLHMTSRVSAPMDQKL